MSEQPRTAKQGVSRRPEGAAISEAMLDRWENTWLRRKLGGRFDRITGIGTTPDMSRGAQKSIIIVNSFALVSFLITFPYLPIGMALGMTLIPAIALSSLGFLSVLILNARRHYRTAKYVITLFSLVGIGSWSLLWGTAAGIHLFYLAYAFATMIIFSHDQEIVAVLMAFLGLTAMVAIELFGNLDPVLGPAYDPELARYLSIATLTFVGMACVGFGYYARSAADDAEQYLELERSRTDALLLNILPQPIAERLKRDPSVIADGFDGLTVVFSDIANFTPLSESLAPAEVITLLNRIFTEFDHIMARHGIEKIKTIGDAYMAVAGVPDACPDHAQRMADAALEMRAAALALTDPHGRPVELRIGLNTGPAIAGVIGAHKFTYDLWGDTVNTASRMESHGEPGRIQVSEATYHALQSTHLFCERGTIEVKGKGPMQTWWLEGRKEPGNRTQ